MTKRQGFLALVMWLLAGWPYISQASPTSKSLSSEKISVQLLSAYQKKTGSYPMHTEHRNKDGSPKYINRLIQQDSPYLLQHAHNPVDWYGWGDEAFERAKAENKPIFLSIGYSTCHWCHVMARESFDDEAIAAILNQHFISIKVDREQHPDVDEIYMTGVQIVSGRGGWPMSSFLTPQGKPFFGATYFPPKQFLQLLQKINNVWRQDELILRADAEKISEQIGKMQNANQKEELSENAIESAVRVALRNYDERYGGFSAAPKFPNESTLLFLLDQWRREDIAHLPQALTQTLKSMAMGGVYDQVGGGFHRYSTDEQWLVPHFEKMLYNQALLSRVYTEAWQLSGDEYYSRISREILDYVLRDMRNDKHCFYSASDADSEGEEGVFFVWTPKQLREVLSEKQTQWLLKLYGVTEQGNFEGSNILYLPREYPLFLAEQGETSAQFYVKLKELKKNLYTAREQRVHPLRDEKIITAWNAMMITALAQGSSMPGARAYLHAAESCAETLYKTQWSRKTKQLWRISWQGNSSVTATQEDFAYLIEAMIALYDASGEPIWLARAKELTEQMIIEFWDGQQGGFFFTSLRADRQLITRPKSGADGAMPSGSAVALSVLDQLSARSGEFVYKQRFKETLASMSASINRYPLAYAYSLRAIDNARRGESGSQIVMAQGHIKVALSKVSADSGFIVKMDIEEGWHINAAQIEEQSLVASKITATDKNWQIEELQFPPAENLQLEFLERPLAVLQGELVIKGKAKWTAQEKEKNMRPLRITIIVQACERGRCLAPETRVLTQAF